MRFLARPVWLILLMAVTPVAAQEQDASPEPEAVWLAAHNAARAEAGLAPLQWSAALARDAEGWAIHLAERRAFHHSAYEARGGQGENLWRGTRGHYAPWQMMAAFTDEKRHFRPGIFPEVSRTGRWSDVGHYTQIIWPETRSVGCALARGRGEDVLVCRYWPAGNVIGQRLEPKARLSRR